MKFQVLKKYYLVERPNCNGSMTTDVVCLIETPQGSGFLGTRSQKVVRDMLGCEIIFLLFSSPTSSLLFLCSCQCMQSLPLFLPLPSWVMISLSGFAAF